MSAVLANFSRSFHVDFDVINVAGLNGNSGLPLRSESISADLRPSYIGHDLKCAQLLIGVAAAAMWVVGEIEIVKVSIEAAMAGDQLSRVVVERD